MIRKCDEARPTCKACTLRKETCVYPVAPTQATSSPSTSSPPADSQVVVRTSLSRPAPYYDTSRFNVVQEPLFCPGEVTDAVDMKMLWFYTTSTFHSFSTQSGQNPTVDYVLKVKMVEQAFQSPFLMDCLLALSSLHLQTLNQAVPYQRSVSYRARAFCGYRKAIETAKPSDYPALLACSLLMCALSSQMFRDPDGQPPYIIDWMAVWRGIGLIMDIVTPQAVQDSEMACLFVRPSIDLERSARYIPNDLLFMISSIKHDDPDYEHQKLYYEYLRHLGSLYMELNEHGFSPILDLRIATFLTFVPRPFLPLAKQHRSRALIMLAYYLIFTKLLEQGIWWMRGITNREIESIAKLVDSEYARFLRVPQLVMRTSTKTEAARIIIDDQNWTPSELDLYNKNRDPRCFTDVKLIDNEGDEVELVDGHWRLKASGQTWTRYLHEHPTAVPGTWENEPLASAKDIPLRPFTPSISASSGPDTPSE
ncbi:hypothetical protein F4780DRAFT_407603 [Xylariomycetidae sp. FL0641]|nr:hypothetical protein F4780DRAFT_407603 [Xylariomycetidae sp. FL0641]